MPVKFDASFAEKFISQDDFKNIAPKVLAAADKLHNGTGEGSEFTGWLNLAQNYDKGEFARIKSAAEKIRADSDVLIVIGIGGSYLGARAAIEFLQGNNYNLLNTPQILFAGNSLSGQSLDDVLALCEGKRVSLCVISKSGTTMEPAVAFRVLRGYMEKRYANAAKDNQRFARGADRPSPLN